MANSWQVAEARRHFADVIDAASHGEPQFIARRDGSEVVVVSKSYFNATRPNLRTALLANAFGSRGDMLDQALSEAREVLGAAVTVAGEPDADRS